MNIMSHLIVFQVGYRTLLAFNGSYSVLEPKRHSSL